MPSEPFLKKSTFEEAYKLAFNVNEKVKLVPVGNWIIGSSYIADMMKWRNVHRQNFFFDGKVDIFSFERYVLTPFLSENSRLLFSIFVDGVFAGHVGMNNLGRGSFEVTQVVKGRFKPEFQMHVVISVLLKIYKEKFNLSKASLHVKEHNERAITLYKKCGFDIVGACGKGHTECTFMSQTTGT